MSTTKDKTMEFLEDLLMPDIEEMTPQEVEAVLEDAGIDAKEFDRRIAGLAREIATRERRERGSAPRYLRDVITQLDPAGPLPDGLAAARQKAGEWIAGIAEGVRKTTPEATILASYRNRKEEMSTEDESLLEREKSWLLERIKPDDETE